MRKLIFKKYFNRDLFLVNQNIDLDELIIKKKSLKTELSNYFNKLYRRKYNHDNKERINEKVKNNCKYRYHNDEEYRKNKIEQNKKRRLMKLGITECKQYIKWTPKN